MANNQLNWSHFKPDFSRKPEEDAEAHLLRTMDWMTTHDFPEGQKVRRFCLTLLVEVEDAVTDKITMVQETDHIVDTSIKTTIGEEETTATEVVIEIIGPIIGIAIGAVIGTVIEMVTDITIID